MRYRDYTIRYDPLPIPIRDHDWLFVHDEYNGPPDPRCGTGASFEDCRAQIDELERAP